jgi:hypothetical protein
LEQAYKEQKKELLIKTLGAWVDEFVARWLDNRLAYNRESSRWIRGEVASIMERTGSHLSDAEREGRDAFFVTRVLNAFSKIENTGERIDRIVEAIENPFVELCARHYRAGESASGIREKINDIREENFLFTYLTRSIKGVLALEVYSQLPTVDREAFIESSALRDPLARPRKDLHLPARSRSLYDANIDDADDFANAVNAAGLINVTASVDSSNRIVITHATGGDILIGEGTGTPFNNIFATSGLNATANLYDAATGDVVHDYIATQWKALSFEASATEITALALDQQLWYNSIVDEVDILINDGTNWVGYTTATSPFFAASAGLKTYPAGPIVSAIEPE